MSLRRALIALLLVCCGTAPLWADAGLLIPKNRGGQPDPAVLSLDRMDLDIAIDGRFARVKTLQVFGNHTGTDLEAEYAFFLPAGTSISDFAIWEEGVRIPGVILERARARMHYENLTWNKIDPGLLEKSEHAEESNTFSVKVYPIPAHGAKRLEIEYTQELPMSGGRATLVYPLRPARYRELSCKSFSLHWRLRGGEPLESLSAAGGAIKPVETASPVSASPGSGAVAPVREGSFRALDLKFTDDFRMEMVYPAGGTRTQFLTFRDPSRLRKDLSPFGAGRVYSDSRGYFLYDLAFDLSGDRAPGAGPEPKRDPLAVSILFDCSLSMQWQKLDEAFEVLRGALARLGPEDRFTLALFNDKVAPMPGGLLPGSPKEQAAALDFVRAGSLAGGTDLGSALSAGLAPLAAAPAGFQRILLLVSDGHATESPLRVDGLTGRFKEGNAGTHARLMAFGVGSDANRALLGKLASESEGQFTWAAETEDVASPLRGFLDRFGRAAIKNVGLTFAVPGNVETLYPDGGTVAYDRCSARFVGRYKGPLASTGVTLSYVAPSGPVTRETQVDLPEVDRSNPQLPRIWARERVDFLLERIALEGEKEEWIVEIIALAREHKFVTPYTSFLAAPRALLRPRVIKPGDPVLRVKTGTDIRAVVAVFPFGLTRALQFDAEAKLWETRFLAPRDMSDGTYSATLVLTDQDGRKFLEEKSFVIDGTPPSMRVVLPARAPAAGAEFLIKVFSDADTRRITARLLDLPPIDLRYDPRELASTALVRLPASLPAAELAIRLTAEDFAHNVGFAEARVVVK